MSTLRPKREVQKYEMSLPSLLLMSGTERRHGSGKKSDVCLLPVVLFIDMVLFEGDKIYIQKSHCGLAVGELLKGGNCKQCCQYTDLCQQATLVHITTESLGHLQSHLHSSSAHGGIRHKQIKRRTRTVEGDGVGSAEGRVRRISQSV